MKKILLFLLTSSICMPSQAQSGNESNIIFGAPWFTLYEYADKPASRMLRLETEDQSSVLDIICSSNKELHTVLTSTKLTPDLIKLRGANVVLNDDRNIHFNFSVYAVGYIQNSIIFDPEHMRLKSKAAVTFLRFIARSNGFSIKISEEVNNNVSFDFNYD